MLISVDDDEDNGDDNDYKDQDDGKGKPIVYLDSPTIHQFHDFQIFN